MKFSVIIPVYNVKYYLEACINSVIAQKYKEYEVIMVDDGSTDGSGEICDELCRKYSNFKVIHQRNQGLSSARNRGVVESSGEYILFLDSDDLIISTDSLECLANITRSQDLIVYDIMEFSGADCSPSSDYSTLKGIKKSDYTSGKQYLLDALEANVAYRWYACNYLYRREFWVKKGFEFPVGIKYEDVPTTYKVLLAAKGISVVNKKIYGYRRNREDAITTVHSYKALSDLYHSVSESIDYINMTRKEMSSILVERLCTNMSLSIVNLLIYANDLNKQDFNRLIGTIETNKRKFHYMTNYSKGYAIV